MLPQWCFPRMCTCGRWNASFWICMNVEVLMKVYNWWLHHDKLFYGINFYSNNFICSSLTLLTLFLFVERVSAMHSTTFNVLIDMKTYDWGKFWIMLIWFWNWKINLWKFCTITQKNSIVVIHNFIIDMHTLLSFSYQILSESYAFYVAWQYFYMYQINYWPFHQTFCSVYYRFDL